MPTLDPRVLEELTRNLTAQQPPVQNNVRNLQMQSGDPGAILSFSRGQSQTVAGNVPEVQDPYGRFNGLLTQLLQRHQQLGTKKFQEQSLNAQQEQVTRTQQTPSNLIGASPDIQNSVRSGAVNALDSTISGAEQGQRTFSEQITGLGNSITSAKNLIKEYSEIENKKRDDARLVINSILTTTDPESLKGLNQDELNALEKISGYPKGFLASAITYKQKQLESAKTFSTVDLGDKVGVFDNQGNMIKSYPKSAAPKSVDTTKDAGAKAELLGLLGQYRDALKDSNTLSRSFNPSVVAKMDSLKGQITSVYKKQQQLGTLDLGVQKLIDAILGGGGLFDVANLSTQAKLDALDNFINNQGGTPGSPPTVAPAGNNEFQIWLKNNGLL